MGWVPCQINCISNPALAGRRYSRGNAEMTGVRPGTQGIQGTLKSNFRPYVKGWEGPRRTCSEYSWGRFSASELRLGRIKTQRRHWQPTPVLLAGESHGQRSLVGCSPWGRSELDMTDFTFTFHFPALEKEMATHSSVLAWRIPGMGEPAGLPSMGSHTVRHDWSDLAGAAELGGEKGSVERGAKKKARKCSVGLYHAESP